ncbi:MAG: NifU N-terminal domain-containing protein, partial [Bacteroidia bacterium]|nr:NifU N-terminal domain-containing protein [Bacteroidia bacterium]MDW8335187.1 NifU N-terminal domain-containing protein [Bacteroidia bacterium]
AEWGAYEWTRADWPSGITLADDLLVLEGVERVYLAGNFITVVKDDAAKWEVLFPLVRDALRTALKQPPPSHEHLRKHAIVMPHDERGMAEWMAAKILPATERDGGGIFFVGMESPHVVVLRAAGACKGCPHLPETVEKGVLAPLRMQKSVENARVI